MLSVIKYIQSKNRIVLKLLVIASLARRVNEGSTSETQGQLVGATGSLSGRRDFRAKVYNKSVRMMKGVPCRGRIVRGVRGGGRVIQILNSCCIRCLDNISGWLTLVLHT